MIRFFDLVFASLAIIVLSPVLVPVAILLRLTGEGEVFFRQTRIGLHGKSFRLWKFATMQKNSPNIGTGVLTLKNDPRVLPVGRFLRRAKINELPQLLNVLSGDMSLVGPRPQAVLIFGYFPPHTQDVLKTVRPGLSGLGSILFRDEESIVDTAADKESFYRRLVSPYKGEIECWYARHQSTRLYFSLIFLTLWVLAFPRSQLPWRVLRGLPSPPLELRQAMQTGTA